MRMHGMRITDYLEYYQGKEWVIRKQFHSWEELAWELIRGSVKSIAGSCTLRKEHVFLLISFFQINRFQNNSVHSISGDGMTRIVFRSFRNWNVTQKNASCFSSVCSHSGIVPKECTLSIYKELPLGERVYMTPSKQHILARRYTLDREIMK